MKDQPDDMGLFYQNDIPELYEDSRSNFFQIPLKISLNTKEKNSDASE